MKQTRFVIALLLALSIVVGINNIFAQENENTLVDVIARATGGTPSQFTAISAALQAADPAISEALGDSSQYFTIFAPADAAFAGLPTTALGGLLGDQALLSGILSYHVVEGFYPVSQIEEAIVNDGGLTLTTLAGEEIVISRNERGTFVNNAFLREGSGYLADNGVIHIVESVLFPPSSQDQLNALLSGGSAEEAEEEVVEEEAIPSSAEQVQSAISNLLGATTSTEEVEVEEEVVEEEAIPSSAEQVQSAISNLLGATTSAEEIEEAIEEEAVPSSAEQVGSAIDRLLGASSSNETGEDSGDSASADATIAELLNSAGNFETLNLILTNAATDYNTYLSEAGEYTIFAPTDEAFTTLASALGIDIRAALVFPDILIDMVGYHIVEGIITGDDLVDGTEFVTIQGESVPVSIVDGFIILNELVAISITDIPASNGVLHVIDGVLIPQSTIATFATLGITYP